MVKINKNKCIGCGVCASICPEGIEMSEGKANIKNENVGCLESAAKSCPRGVILIGSKEKDSEKENIAANQRLVEDDRRQGLGKGMGGGFRRGRSGRRRGRRK